MMLYKITVEHTFLMVAENEDDARMCAQHEAAEALRTDTSADSIIRELVEDIDDIPPEWRKACPYGEGGNAKTCEEWMSS